ncbi:MAG TPA: Lpg1974 family pore-forming outer membrane protein, partial [Gemmataceae bacterium]|nr:Lpg1974 family pore-forming outer membrane protein [Gemmataceae bacterium]
SLAYETQPGFRATLAYRVPGHGWDLGITYLYFNSRDDFATTAGPSGLVYPLLTRAGLTNDAQGALARARLTMNVYDIELGRRWDADDTLRFRFVGGVRLTTVRQSLEAVYDGRDADLAFARTESNFDGVGPMAGLESTWALTKSFGVFGRGTAGLLTGTMRNPFVETNNGGATTYVDVADRYALTVPFATLGIGLSYEYRGLFFRAGYEVTNYFGLVERPYYVNDFAEGKVLNRSSNLALDGMFLQFGLAF